MNSEDPPQSPSQLYNIIIHILTMQVATSIAMTRLFVVWTEQKRPPNVSIHHYINLGETPRFHHRLQQPLSILILFVEIITILGIIIIIIMMTLSIRISCVASSTNSGWPHNRTHRQQSPLEIATLQTEKHKQRNTNTNCYSISNRDAQNWNRLVIIYQELYLFCRIIKRFCRRHFVCLSFVW